MQLYSDKGFLNGQIRSWVPATKQHKLSANAVLPDQRSHTSEHTLDLWQEYESVYQQAQVKS